MNIVDQIFYDLKLYQGDELGKELVDIVKSEQKEHKNYQVVIHQVLPTDQREFTVILNLIEVI